MAPDVAPVVLADRYELEEVIGRGGMAEVYRATDRVLHRPVAVKLLRDTADDAADRTRFTAEARTLAQLNHPGLVMILDAGTTAAQPYLVLELVEGSTLGRPEVTYNGRPFPFHDMIVVPGFPMPGSAFGIAPLERSGTRSSTSGPKRAGEAFQFRALAETPVPPPDGTLSFGMRGRPP